MGWPSSICVVTGICTTCSRRTPRIYHRPSTPLRCSTSSDRPAGRRGRGDSTFWICSILHGTEDKRARYNRWNCFSGLSGDCLCPSGGQQRGLATASCLSSSILTINVSCLQALLVHEISMSDEIRESKSVLQAVCFFSAVTLLNRNFYPFTDLPSMQSDASPCYWRPFTWRVSAAGHWDGCLWWERDEYSCLWAGTATLNFHVKAIWLEHRSVSTILTSTMKCRDCMQFLHHCLMCTKRTSIVMSLCETMSINVEMKNTSQKDTYARCSSSGLLKQRKSQRLPETLHDVSRHIHSWSSGKGAASLCLGVATIAAKFRGGRSVHASAYHS